MDDTLLRWSIINDIDKNIFVDASAGAGKTASLVRRMVRMVESGIEVDKICTITFTKNAANEFYERFQALLSKRSKALKSGPYDLMPDPTDETRARCEMALKNIDLCFMGTIDSFTNMIISEHPSPAGLASGATIASEDEITKLLKGIYFNIRDGVYDKDYPTLSEKLKAYKKSVRDDLNQFLIEMPSLLEKRHVDLVYDKDILDYDFTEFKDMLVNLCLTIKNLNLVEVFDENKQAIVKEFINNINVFKRFNNYHKISYLLKSFIDLKITSKNLKDFDESSPIFDFYYKGKIKYALDPKFSEYYELLIKYRFANAVSFFLESLDIVIKTLKKENCLTFSEFLITLRDMLKKDAGEGAKLIKHIYNNHKYFLLDESQDTNPIQTEIFFYLSAAHPTPIWQECDPREGSLFIVGDPKQSIYKFRGADVGAYLKTKQIFRERYSVIELTKNFRSTVLLRNWFNYSMQDYLREEEGNPKFSNIYIPEDGSAESTATVAGVYSYTVYGDKADEIEENDSKYVISLIKQLVNNPKYTIMTKQDKSPRLIKYSDFMVVTRKKKFAKLLEILDKENIPYYSEGLALFDSCPLLTLIKKVLYFSASPSNEIYYYNLFTSELGGITKEELDEDVVESMDEETKAKVEAKKDKVLDLIRKLIAYPMSTRFEYLLENCDLAKLVSLNNIDIAYYALELTRRAEADGLLSSSEEIIKFLDGLSSSNKDYERSLRLFRSDNSIKISNVHKVKGLQAPIVILCARNKRKTSSNKNLIDNETSKYIPLQFAGISISDTTIQEECDMQAMAEDKRIDYVAITRAEACLFVGKVVNSKGETKPSSWDGISAYIDKTFALEEVEQNQNIVIKDINELLEEQKDDVITFNNLTSASYNVVLPSKLKYSFSDTETSLEDFMEDLTNSDAKKVGTLIHKMMELCAKSRLSIGLDKVLCDIHTLFGDEYDELLTEIYTVLSGGGFSQTNGVEADIFKTIKNAKEVMCEIPFAYLKGNELINGVIDLLYLDDKGWHIIDYKTGKESDSLVLNETYANQLTLYKDALADILGIDADANIYHLSV